jgi:S-adenosylmethionine:tRNA ribosyltransferase-isomerase
MDLSDFDYELPPELIAQTPSPERTASRLLQLHGAGCRIEDRRFAELGDLLAPGDLLVLNDTRVVPARLYGHKATGGRVEMLLERLTGPRTALVQLRASRSPRVGAVLAFPDAAVATVAARHDELFELRFDRDVAPYLERWGEVPLPPYIDRSPERADAERYQTVYARQPGAVAAPTAGLHFDADLLAALADRGIANTRLTLHVGLGTFAPVRCDDIREHRLHAELVDVSDELCRQIDATRARGGRVVAVGTTTVRALESAAASGRLAAFAGETRLFIYPGFRFRVVDALITNFHLPKSSLLMLVAAFVGRDCMMDAYRHAVAQRYRFFSYGDAMLIWPGVDPQGRADAL